jgi:hypothetical protein
MHVHDGFSEGTADLYPQKESPLFSFLHKKEFVLFVIDPRNDDLIQALPLSRKKGKPDGYDDR